MNAKAIIALVITLLVLVVAAWIISALLHPLSSQNTQQANDSTAQISTYLKNVPPDPSLDQDMQPLDKNIKEF